MKFAWGQTYDIHPYDIELSQIWLSDSDWAGAKDLGAVRFKMDPDVLMEAPGWPHELHTFEKVVLTDPQLTEKSE